MFEMYYFRFLFFTEALCVYIMKEKTEKDG